jgi:hypothetical protein
MLFSTKFDTTVLKISQIFEQFLIYKTFLIKKYLLQLFIRPKGAPTFMIVYVQLNELNETGTSHNIFLRDRNEKIWLL